MKIVIAMDSFKGSLTSMEARRAAEKGIRRIFPDGEMIVKPVADGGEGTTEVLADGMGGEMVYVTVHGPLENKVQAGYGYIRETGTAIMEMADAAGIVLVGKDKRPLDATTYGVGEMIKDAISRGCRDFIIGIGGSATNDGGMGMLEALGYEFADKDGKPVFRGAKGLGQVAEIRTEKSLPLLKECRFRIACDVTNPLCGENGATFVFGPQKGVTEEMKASMDQDMTHFAEVTKKYTGTDCAGMEGAGAAGGLGFAFLSYLQGKLEPGISLVLEAVHMEKAMEGADLVFTGEGCLDEQTAMGKAPSGIAKLAKKAGARVIALSGAVAQGAEKCNENGIDAYFPIIRRTMSLEEAMEKENAAANMADTAEQIMRLYRAVAESAY